MLIIYRLFYKKLDYHLSPGCLKKDEDLNSHSLLRVSYFYATETTHLSLFILACAWMKIS